MEMEEEEALVPLMRNRKTKSKNESSVRLNPILKINENSSSQKISDRILAKFGIQNYGNRKKLYFIIGAEVREISCQILLIVYPSSSDSTSTFLLSFALLVYFQ